MGIHSNIEIMHTLNATQQTVPTGIKLSPRGAEVFTLILQSTSNTHIAEHLGVSYSAVRRHREKMLLDNGCSTMNELIAKYYGQIDEVQP